MSDKIPSTSDERTKNNVMRHEYRVLTDDEKHNMKVVKDMGLAFINHCDAIGGLTIGPDDKVALVSSRELALAKTKIEEAVMWAVKHITK